MMSNPPTYGGFRVAKKPADAAITICHRKLHNCKLTQLLGKSTTSTPQKKLNPNYKEKISNAIKSADESLVTIRQEIKSVESCKIRMFLQVMNEHQREKSQIR